MLLLADIFADYGKRSYETYQLDPIYCVSSPGFSNRAMLKCTSAEIKLIIDNSMHLIIEKGSRGGRCEPLLLKAEANNKYVNKNFDKNKDTEKYLVSLDVNSLYQTAMTDKLPNGSFKYVDDISTFTTEYILSLNENGDYYYTFVANFDYPKKLHTEHNELLLLCDQEIPPKDTVKKLMSTLNDKKNYLISFAMLRFVFKKGLVLKRIHTGFYAKQEAFIKKYITSNNDKRTECSKNKDKIGAESYKLISNSGFGKLMENVKRYKVIRIVNNPVKGKKSAAKTTYKDIYPLSETVALYVMRKGSVLLDKPIAVGFAILEKSKAIMYEHYFRLKKHFGDSMELIYMDTDSLKLQIIGKKCI